jgi:hypothetical protein
MAKPRLKLSPTGIRQIERMAVVGIAAKKTANKIARRTAKNATMEEYASSIKVKREGTGATVFTDNSFAHLEEWGSVNWSGTAPMRKAARALGLSLRGS